MKGPSDGPVKRQPPVHGALLCAALVLALPGIILYLASYFWGAWLIAGAIVVLAAERLLTRGPAELWTLTRSLFSRAVVPLEGVCLALLIGAAIMAATGHDPLQSYGALFYGGLVKNWHVSVLNATPLVFTGLAIAIAFHAGLFNIGAEGQYYAPAAKIRGNVARALAPPARIPHAAPDLRGRCAGRRPCQPDPGLAQDQNGGP